MTLPDGLMTVCRDLFTIRIILDTSYHNVYLVPHNDEIDISMKTTPALSSHFFFSLSKNPASILAKRKTIHIEVTEDKYDSAK